MLINLEIWDRSTDFYYVSLLTPKTPLFLEKLINKVTHFWNFGSLEEIRSKASANSEARQKRGFEGRYLCEWILVFLCLFVFSRFWILGILGLSPKTHSLSNFAKLIANSYASETSSLSNVAKLIGNSSS